MYSVVSSSSVIFTASELHVRPFIILQAHKPYLLTYLISAIRPESYFPSHPERNTYVSLLQMSDPPAPDSILKAALVRRAMGDVRRVIQLREDKPALQALLQKGCVGEDLWNSLLAAEKELEAEIVEVVAEANSFVEGWGTIIFPTANEMIANERMRALYETQIPTKLGEAGEYRVWVD